MDLVNLHFLRNFEVLLLILTELRLIFEVRYQGDVLNIFNKLCSLSILKKKREEGPHNNHSSKTRISVLMRVQMGNKKINNQNT